jgi:hypothetical protein
VVVVTDLPRLVQHVAHFQARVVQDALAEASYAYWMRRAEQLEAALPRPGDYPGRAPKEEREARRASVEARAQACRQHVELLRILEEER